MHTAAIHTHGYVSLFSSVLFITFNLPLYSRTIYILSFNLLMFPESAGVNKEVLWFDGLYVAVETELILSNVLVVCIFSVFLLCVSF